MATSAGAAMDSEVPYTTYKTSTGDLSLQGVGQQFQWWSKKRILVGSLVGGITLGLLVGLLIGFLTNARVSSSEARVAVPDPVNVPPNNTVPNNTVPNYTKNFDIADQQAAVASINGSAMASFVKRYFQGQLLLPASSGSREQANSLLAVWKSYGTPASTVRKVVLMSRPGQSSSVTLLNATLPSSNRSCAVSNESRVISAASVAYAPAGSVTGALVFANYGLKEDFANLSSFANVAAANSSRVAVMRYGKINLSDKLRNAASWGASAVVLYHDSDEYDLDPCLPAYGNAKSIHGDPSTPSIGILSDTAYSIDIKDAVSLYGGALPAVSISPVAAGQLLAPFLAEPTSNGSSAAQAAAATWRTLGSDISLAASSTGSYAVSINSSSEWTRDEIGMVFCVVHGTIETDRMIFVGAHHDALDRRTSQEAGTGAAIQNELLRILTARKAAGWKPRRSIVFGSFDATSMQVGSREWTESNSFEFQNRGVAYVHLGASVTGTDFTAAVSVGLANMLMSATGNISSVEGTGLDLFSQWKSKTQAARYPPISGRGDFSSFTAYIGIPSIQMRFTSVLEKPWPASVSCCRQNISTETPAANLLSKLTEAYLAVIMRLSDSAILPYDVTEISDTITRGVAAVNRTEAVLAANNISLAGLRAGSAAAVSKFKDLSSTLIATIPLAHRFSNLKVRRISDMLLALTRVFVHPSGVPMIKNDQVIPNINNRNMLFGPLSYDENSVREFPGVFELLERAASPDHWNALRKHIAEITLAMDGAVNYMVRGIMDNTMWIPDL